MDSLLNDPASNLNIYISPTNKDVSLYACFDFYNNKILSIYNNLRKSYSSTPNNDNNTTWRNFENNIIRNEKKIGEGNIRVLVNDSEKVEILNKSLRVGLNKIDNIKKAIDYTFLAKQKFEQVQNREEYGRALMLLSKEYNKKGDIANAIKYSKKTLEVYKELQEEAPKLKDFEGKLGDGETLIKYFEVNEKVSRKAEKIYIYAHLRCDEDTSNTKYQAMMNKIVSAENAKTLASSVVPQLRQILLGGLKAVYIVSMIVILISILLNQTYKDRKIKHE